MGAWFGPVGEWQPSPMPEPRDGAAYAVSGDRLYVLGGYGAGYAATTATVYAYDLLTDAWTVETPLSVAVEAYARAVSIGDSIYLVEVGGAFYRYDTGTGVTTALAASGVIGAHDLALIDGSIYHGLATPAPRVYDVAAGAWGDAPGASPYAAPVEFASVAEHDGSIIVLGGIANATAWQYSPHFARWDPLPDLPFGLAWSTAFRWRGQVLVTGGERGATGLDEAYLLDRAHSAWAAFGAAEGLLVSGQAGGVLHGRVVIAGGYDYATEDATAATAAFGANLDELDVRATVDLFSPYAEMLNVQVDIIGGIGAYADLLIAFTIPREYTFDLPVRVDVLDEPAALPTLPVPVDSEDRVVIPPGPATPTVPRAINGCDQYDFSWGFGDGVSGEALAYGRDGDPAPSGIPFLDRALDRQHTWTRDGDIVATRPYDSATRVALETTVLPELAPIDETLDSIIGGKPPGQGINGRAGLYPLDAPLCSGSDSLVFLCAPGVRDGLQDLRDAARPTRRQLAIAAAAQAGVALAIHNGAGLVGLDDPIPREYQTAGASAQGVISDLLLAAGAYAWALPGVLILDGRPMPTASLADPDPSLEGLFADGGATVVTIGVTQTDSQPLNLTAPVGTHPLYPPEPDLADFLAECEEGFEEGDTGGVGTGTTSRTFETMDSGTLRWTERGGAGIGYFEVQHEIVKANGRVVSETRRRSGWRYIPRFGGISSWWGEVETSLTTHEYVSCCPSALARSVELVYVAKTLDLAPGFDEATGTIGEDAIRWWNLIPWSYLHSRKVTTQRWQAQGWLRARSESSTVFDGFEFSETPLGSGFIRSVRPTYNINGREELNTPVGGGVWHRAVRVNETVLIPIREIRQEVIDEVPTLVNEIVGSQRSEAINTYTEETDASPPTVSCGAADPCADPITGEPLVSCEERQTEAFEEAHAAWQREVAVLDANRLMRPRRVLAQTYTWVEHLPGIAVGDRVETSRGPGIVARVSWGGSGPRSGAPQQTTTAEVWSALP